MRISDWSSDVCSSYLLAVATAIIGRAPAAFGKAGPAIEVDRVIVGAHFQKEILRSLCHRPVPPLGQQAPADPPSPPRRIDGEQQQFAFRPGDALRRKATRRTPDPPEAEARRRHGEKREKHTSREPGGDREEQKA